MATLADLFASTQAPNVNQLRAQPVAYQRGGSKLGKAVGTVGDILAAIGGRNPMYEGTMQARENAYNQSMKEQQFQNVFRNFVENPNDPMVQANLAYENPEAFLKVAPQNRALGNRVVRMGPLGTPEVVVEAPVEPVAAPKPTGFEALVAARSRYPEGSPERALIEAKIAKDTYIAPQRAGGSGVGGGAPSMGKPPAGYRWAQDGNLTPIPGGPKDPANKGGVSGSVKLVDTQELINSLLSAEKQLQKGGVTGRAVGATPDSARPFLFPRSTQVEEDVASVTQRNLKEILGGQFARVEGEQLIKRGFNPALGDKVNLQRVQSLRRRLEAVRDEEIRRQGGRAPQNAPPANLRRPPLSAFEK